MEFEHIKKYVFERDVSQLNYRVARDGEFWIECLINRNTRSEYIQKRYSYLYLFSIIHKSEKHKKITTRVKITKKNYKIAIFSSLISKNWRPDTTKRVQRLVRFHATFEAITVLTIPRRNGESRVKRAGSGISIGQFLCGTFPRFVKWPTQIFPSGNAKHFRAENRANEIPPESSCSLSLARKPHESNRRNGIFISKHYQPPSPPSLCASHPLLRCLRARVSVFTGHSLFRERTSLLFRQFTYMQRIPSWTRNSWPA